MKNVLRITLAGIFLTACAPNTRNFQLPGKESPQNVSSLLQVKFQPNELAQKCDAAMAAADVSLKALAAIPVDKRNFDNTMLAFETITADMSDLTTSLSFMSYVSTDEKTRSEGADCESKSGQFRVEVFSRKEIYNAIKDAKPRNSDESRLTEETLKGFVKSGMNLSDDKLAQVKDLNQKLADLQSKYSANLNNDVSTLILSQADLAGMPDDFIARLKKTSDGQFIVTTKGTDYSAVMQNASKPQTRQKMLLAWENRQADVNTKLLTDAVQLRQQIATLMGYKTWADFQLDGRMAKDAPTVMKFLGDLKDKLAKRSKEDLNNLLLAKKKIDPNASNIDPWDINYFDYQVKKTDYSLDNEKIKEYFPASVVMKGLFEVYSQLLSVHYKQVTNATVWNPDVQLYEIRDNKDDRLIGYFYTDFVPREGKYNHAAAFSLLSARQTSKGYALPVSAIVANISPPSGNKPSLLSHDDVVTVFHEFGHIMHQTLTRAPYASLSGSSVAQDFVEAPSQMLENWVWNEDILSSLSGHYLDNSKKLPPELLKQMLAARDFDQGYYTTRQLLLALYDMGLHSQNGPVDVTAFYAKMYQDLIGIPLTPGSHFPASFGHLMGGYDAGYYGYMWSLVYATDMFTRFENAPNKLRDSVVGAQYRSTILESGDMQDAFSLLKTFLGRDPNPDAFYRKLHILP